MVGDDGWLYSCDNLNDGRVTHLKVYRDIMGELKRISKEVPSPGGG